MYSISQGDVGLEVDEGANLVSVTRGELSFRPQLPVTYWEIDGAPATLASWDFVESDRLRYTLAAGMNRVRLGVRCTEEIVFACEPTDGPAEISFSLPVPDTARFHVPEAYNACRMIDRAMPLHDRYVAKLAYNLLIIEMGNLWLLIRVAQGGSEFASLALSRQPALLTGSIRWGVGHELAMSLHSSLNEAMARYDRWLQDELQIVPWADDPAVPRWVANVKLVVTMDMMRSNWTVAHDYADVANAAGELARAGAPPDTLFYLPGSNGAFDSGYPDHGPHEALGGSDGFRTMVESLHRHGFRLMLHANAWGLDPCHRELDDLIQYIVHDQNGGPAGWQTGGTIWGMRLPPSYKLGYRTGNVPVEPEPFRGPSSRCGGAFSTQEIPDACESLVSFTTAYRGPGRLRLSANHRAYLSPPGWFEDHGEYEFPFPFQLNAGTNRFTVELIDHEGDAVDRDCLGDCSYRIRDTFTFTLGCTYPILRADTTNPEWIRIFLDRIAAVVAEYGVDALHVDATHYGRDAILLEELRRRVPGCALSGEELETMGDLKIFAFCQNARLSLLSDLPLSRHRQWRTYTPADAPATEELRWLDQVSPVWEHLKRHIRLYPHLVDAHGFVPTAMVTNWRPPFRVPSSSRLMHRTLRDSARLGYIPGLRLNYREHGLDDETRAAIAEIASR